MLLGRRGLLPYVLAVFGARRAANWLTEQPEIDGKRLGIVGISLGAIIADLALAVDDRFSAGVSIVGGGDVAAVYWRSPILWARRVEAGRRGFTYARLQQLFAPIEPTAYAGRVPPEHVLMINARHDFVMPRECVMKLWEAFGRPQLLWVDSGHRGAFVALRQISRAAADFLTARLGAGAHSGAPLELCDPRLPVRLRLGLFASKESGIRPGLSLRLVSQGQVSIELLMTTPKPLISVSLSPMEGVAIGWGPRLLGGGKPLVYLGFFVTL
jgi:hypothetical protein